MQCTTPACLPIVGLSGLVTVAEDVSLLGKRNGFFISRRLSNVLRRKSYWWTSVALQMIALWCVSLVSAVPAVEPISNRDEHGARPLPLSAVRLTGGPLKHAQDLDARYLLELEPDRMLADRKSVV